AFPRGAVSSPAASPFLWGGLAALFLGLALGEALRWIVLARRGAERRAARRSAWAATFLALSLAAAALLLVLPAKADLLEPLLPWWAGALSLAGLAAGLAPRAAGVPLAGLGLAAALLLLDGLAGWLPLRGPGPVARFLPFAATDAGFSGQLEIQERDTVPTLQKLELPLVALALVVERVELAGPAALVAGPRFYRVVGAAGPDGAMAADFPARKNLVDRLAPLPEGPGGEARGLFLRRRRETSAAVSLAALEPVVFSFAPAKVPGGLVLEARAGERPFGGRASQ
ncbi:MAG: hypothetical protein JNG85_15955, partial [Spirochaetaceae bacterium]|nr:hypothetical protein [Spirochaetaceae bacterium]